MAAQHTVEQANHHGQTPEVETPACPGGAHHLQVVGYLRGPRPVGLDCEKPLRVVCRDTSCTYSTTWRCSGHRESVCRPCAGRYRRRVRAVAYSGTTAQRRSGGHLYLLTLTAPGQRQHRLPSGELCPCTPVGGVDLHAWNASHSARWNRLRTRLRQLHPELQFFRAVEVQDRGALHHHAITWSPVELSLKEVRRLAIQAGYGHSVDLAPTRPGSRGVSNYCAKYVTKACDQRGEVPWADLETGEVTEGKYRTWSMSRDWGLTMAAVKQENLELHQRLAQERRQLQLQRVDDPPPTAAGSTAAPPG